MKKLLLVIIIYGCTLSSINAQTKPARSAYGHSHKKSKKKYKSASKIAAHKTLKKPDQNDLKALNENGVLSEQQKKDMMVGANAKPKPQPAKKPKTKI